MKRLNKLSTLLLFAVFVFGLLSAPVMAAGPDVTPAQIGVTMTEDPQHSVSITWTTIDTTLTSPEVSIFLLNGDLVKTVDAVKTNRSVSSSNLRNEEGAAVTQKAFYNARIDGLEPDTMYIYICGALDENSEVHKRGQNLQNGARR